MKKSFTTTVITALLIVSGLQMGCASSSFQSSTIGLQPTVNQPDIRAAIEIGRVIGRIMIVKTLTAHGIPEQVAQLAITAIDPVIDEALNTGKLNLIFSPEQFKPVRDALAHRCGKALADAVNDPNLLTPAAAESILGPAIDAVAARARAAVLERQPQPPAPASGALLAPAYWLPNGQPKLSFLRDVDRAFSDIDRQLRTRHVAAADIRTIHILVAESLEAGKDLHEHGYHPDEPCSTCHDLSLTAVLHDELARGKALDLACSLAGVALSEVTGDDFPYETSVVIENVFERLGRSASKAAL